MAQAADRGIPVLSGEAYKQTVAFDYVVKRHIKLFSNRFETYADPAVPQDHRTFQLDETARLLPDSKEGIQQKKRYLRPRGVGSMTALAAVRGKGAPLDLWTFKLKREDHSDFTFCFQDRDTAYQWYDALSQVISALRVAAGKRPLSASQSTKVSFAEGRHGLGDLPRSAFETGAIPSVQDTSAHGSSEGISLRTEDSVVPLTINTSHYGENEEEEEFKRLLDVPTGSTPRPQQRWVPYRHSNGLAIYQQHSKARGEPPEFLVSAVIRGSPTEVLRVLMDPHSATTILGPALEVEVLDSSPGKQTLRIVLQAEGPNAAFFRPREAIVHRILNKQEDGVYAVLFYSVESEADSSSMPADLLPGVIEVAEGVDERTCRTNPIRCRVAGGYTISKRSGYGADSSPETLLTCILQVQDMGGWLNPGHPLFRVVNWWSAGAYEAFLERMLLGVVMVRDIVEKSRFAVIPHVFSEGGALPGVAGQASVPRSSSVVLRRAADTVARGQPGSPSLAPASHRISPFDAAAGSRPMHQQMQQLQQQEVKVSRLASQRLGSGAAGLRIRSRTMTASLGGALPEVFAGAGKIVEEQWDASFQLPEKYYEEIHTPGHDAPFKVRGPRYLSDGVKVAPADPPVFELLGMEVINTGSAEPLPHISRFLPSIRRSEKPFLFVWNMIVPGPPTICCVFVFGADQHPDELGPPPDDPEDSNWEPFDFLMWRFLHGDDEERNSLFKMIPRIAEGSWVIKQSVGTTPVIMGRKLKTTYHITPKYVEVAVDVGSSSTAQYVTGMVRGGAKKLVIDLGVVLEGQHAWELPEVLLGAVRVERLDLAAASMIDTSKEVPLLNVSHQQPADSSTSTSTAAPAVARSQLQLVERE